MDLKPEAMFSRQGKITELAIEVSFRRKKAAPVRPKRVARTLQLSDIDRILDEAEQTRTKSKEKSVLSASFRSVSRKQQAFATRNRTNAPGFECYQPKYESVRPNVGTYTRYDRSTNSPRKPKILVPKCMEDLANTYPHHCRTSSSQSSDRHTAREKLNLNRTAVDLDTYEQIIKSMQEPLSCADKVHTKMHLVTSFDSQVSRTEMKRSQQRSESAGISPKDSLVLSCNRRAPGVPFTLLVKRASLWQPNPLPEYSPDKEAVSAKISTTVLQFEKVTGRKSLALEHTLKNPPPPQLEDLERGWKQIYRSQSNIPGMETLTPRDDLMYRTLEMYNLNVPWRQLATDTPRYLGKSS